MSKTLKTLRQIIGTGLAVGISLYALHTFRTNQDTSASSPIGTPTPNRIYTNRDQTPQHSPQTNEKPQETLLERIRRERSESDQRRINNFNNSQENMEETYDTEETNMIDGYKSYKDTNLRNYENKRVKALNKLESDTNKALDNLDRSYQKAARELDRASRR